MVVGIVLIAMFGAASGSFVLFAYQFPIWVVVLAYPSIGSAILLPGVALVGWIKRHRPDDETAQMLTSQSPAGPRQQSPAGSSGQ